MLVSRPGKTGETLNGAQRRKRDRAFAEALGLLVPAAAVPSRAVLARAPISSLTGRIEETPSFRATGAESVITRAPPSETALTWRAIFPPRLARRGSVPTRSTDCWPAGPTTFGALLDHGERRPGRRAASIPAPVAARRSPRCRERPAESASSRRCRPSAAALTDRGSCSRPARRTAARRRSRCPAPRTVPASRAPVGGHGTGAGCSTASSLDAADGVSRRWPERAARWADGR